MVDRTTRRSRGTSAGITRADVVNAAERVIERVGFRESSIRAVATELEVTPGALYSHVASKEDLFGEVADAFLRREVLENLPDLDDPLALLRLLCRRLWLAGRRRPGIMQSLVGYVYGDATTAPWRTADVMIGLLEEAGADPRRAQLLFRALLTLSLGNAIFDSNFWSSESLEEDRIKIESVSASAPDSRVARYLRQSHSPEEWFDDQIDLVLTELAR